MELLSRPSVNLTGLKQKLQPLMTGPFSVPVTLENRKLIELLIQLEMIKTSDVVFTHPVDDKLSLNKTLETDNDWEQYRYMRSFYWPDGLTHA